MQLKQLDIDQAQKLAEKTLTNLSFLLNSINAMENNRGLVVFGESMATMYQRGEFIFIIIEKCITGHLDIYFQSTSKDKIIDIYFVNRKNAKRMSKEFERLHKELKIIIT